MQNGTSTRPKHGGRAQTLLLAAVFAGITAEAQTPITTAQFNNARTGANLTESTLNTSNVNVSSFGKLRTFSVDGYVYAQPLYVPNLSIGGSSHNVLYVATMTNHLYAFDADTGAQLFEVTPETLGAPVAASSPCPEIDITGPELGVLSTPVIDLLSVRGLCDPNTGAAGYMHRLFKLDITTGQPKLPPVTIAPTFPGTGTDSRNGYVSMNQTSYIQRPGLLLSAENVYAAFGSCGPDPSPYHGWVVGHSAANSRADGDFQY